MDEPRTSSRAKSRRPVWVRITLVVGLVVAGTLLTSMLLSATGIGTERSPMGQHGPGRVATDAGGDRGHDRPPGATGDHSGPATGHGPDGSTQEQCP